MLDEEEKAELRKRLTALHQGDDSQLDVVFSTADRLLVEAPAGYGKTRTMVSVIANMIATGRVANRQRILGLTFSVNAAYKVRRDVAEQVPELLGMDLQKFRDPTKGRVYISNYHGFCRGVLRLYGSLVDERLRSIDNLRGIDDSDACRLLSDKGIPGDVTWVLTEMDNAIRVADERRLEDLRDSYLSLVRSELLSREYITFNAILLFVDTIFRGFEELHKFYTTLYPIVVVDEFQDTNILGWRLLKLMVAENTTLILMGDELQRIYGFIGAIPNLLTTAQKLFAMQRVSLRKNHRFEGNIPMTLLDKAIRERARSPLGLQGEESAEVPIAIFDTQEEEADWIADTVRRLVHQDASVAVLVTQRGPNAAVILESLNRAGVQYFYGLFRDESPQYISFHSEALSAFLRHLQTSHVVGALASTYSELKKKYGRSSDQTMISLLRLLEIFVERVRTEYSELPSDEKVLLIREAFEGRALRQNMQRLRDSAVVSTIHGAKGLEWDYVILSDMERSGLPRYQFCKNCRSSADCHYQYDAATERGYLEELSLFYVGTTRARKQVFFTASRSRLAEKGVWRTNVSCLVRLPGIRLVEA